MALIECKECGKEISDTALSCPHCGAVNSNNIALKLDAEVETKKKNRTFPIVFGIVVSAICGYLVYGNFFEQDPDLKCDSEQSKSLLHDIFQKRDAMILDLGDFKTIEWSKDKTECTARFKGFMTGYFDMKYQVYKEIDNGKKTLGVKIIKVKEAQ